MLKRAARIVALAVVAALTLSGCTPTDEATNSNLIEIELARLSGALTELPYVGVVSAVFDDSEDNGPQIRVAVTVEEPTVDRTIVLADTVIAALSFGAASTVSRSFDLRVGTASLLQLTAFDVDRERLAGEIRYFFALQEQFGAPLSMILSGGWEGNDLDGYQRIIGSTAPLPGDWKAFRRVADPFPSPLHLWYFNGLSASGNLPPIPVMNALESIAIELPGAESPLGYTSSSWDDSTQRLEVNVDSYEERPSKTDSVRSLGLWRAVVQTVGLLKDSGVSKAVFTVGATFAGEYRSSSVHFGDCTMPSVVVDSDEEFVAELADSGIDLPPDSGPGYCTAF